MPPTSTTIRSIHSWMSPYYVRMKCGILFPLNSLEKKDRDRGVRSIYPSKRPAHVCCCLLLFAAILVLALVVFAQLQWSGWR